MMRISVRVSNDTATEAGKRLQRALKPNQLAGQVAVAGELLYRSHFKELAAQRHRAISIKGRENFYAEAEDSTIGTHSGGTAFITVSGPVGLRQRIQGGDIAAVNAFALFIPIPGSPAEGRTPGDFAGELAIIWNATTKRGVAKQKGKDGQVLFALRDMVSQAPDDTVVPSQSDLSVAMRSAIARRLQRAWKNDAAAADMAEE